ncbi:MAG: hypothetical protein ABR589_04360 [Chthoniobacterales bacterium]
MIETLLRDLRQPEYVHTLLNPLPIYGLAVAVIGLLFAVSIRSRHGQIIALVLVFISAASAWPVVHYGERAYDRVLILADDDGRAWLEEHEERAESLAWFFYALALVAAAAIFLPKKWPQLAWPLALLTLLLALGSLGAGASIAHAGGKIRHREFRTVPPPEKPGGGS